ncbi:MAG: glutathione S-transferase family protein [Alphaproteobacteria bacterium]|nr:glutathione S-transferase family protein [Alphaproteobacteria bacterium]
MAKPILIIGNKNYSSWSLRPYMALAMAGIPFDEKLIHFGTPNFTAKVRRISATGLVPALQHGKLVVWDTLAILEYAAETWPGKNLWPKNKAARAMARALSAEMHAGFRTLRTLCPMNIRRTVKPVAMTAALKADVTRLEQAWAEARRLYGKGGPFLFGHFSNADAMFAPVVSRLQTYAIPVSKPTRVYMDAILATPAFTKWKEAALKEKWIVPEDEVD